MNPDKNRPAGGKSPAKLRDTDYYVLGGGRLGEAVARRLREQGYDAGVVTTTYDSPAVPGLRADPASPTALERAGVPDAAAVLVTVRSDKRGFLVAQRVRTRFEVPRIIVLSSAPDRMDLFEDAGHEAVCATSALSEALVENV